MLQESNIFLFLLGVIPGLLYAFLIFLNSPMRTIRLKPSTFYLLFGMLSILLVIGIHFIFPHITNYVQIIPYTKLGIGGGLFYKPTIFAVFIMNFIQIGFKEELCKALLFFLATWYRQKTKVDNDHPFAIMFYVCMISLGFALIENIQYIWSAFNWVSITPTAVGLRRTFSAILAHMGFGLVMGYFFALASKKIHGNTNDITVLTVWSRHKSKLRKVLLITCGILSATLIHGLYDFNLSTADSTKQTDYIIRNGQHLLHIPSIKLIFFTSVITFFMGKNLLKLGSRTTTT